MNIFIKISLSVLMIFMVYTLVSHQGTAVSNNPNLAPQDFATGNTPLSQGHVISTEKPAYVVTQDPAQTISFEIPGEWKKEEYYSNTGDLSSILSQSPDLLIEHHNEELAYSELKQGGQVYVSVDPSPYVKTLADIEVHNQGGRDTGLSLKDEHLIKIGETEALLYDASGVGDTQGYQLEILHKGKWITLEFEYKGIDGEKVFQRILSTLKLM